MREEEKEISADCILGHLKSVSGDIQNMLHSGTQGTLNRKTW